MDLAVWHQTLDQDVIEENALNEKSCIQVLQLLLSGANAEILELEEDLIILQSQLAWADESWSETCSATLNGKIDYLDLSIRRLENADVHDEHDFSCGLLSHSKPADKIHQLLQPLLENYFHHEHGQKEQAANCIVSKDDLPLETEKKYVAEKEKPADHHMEFRSCALHELPEESDVNPKLTEGLDSALINDIERPLSSFLVGKKRNKSLQKAKPVPNVDKEKKRKRQSLPGVEEAKKLYGFQISQAKSCNNTTASSNAEDRSDRSSDTKCLFTGDSVDSQSPRPSPAARALDLKELKDLKLVELKAIAKQQKMKGYSILNKSQLTEELSLKLRV